MRTLLLKIVNAKVSLPTYMWVLSSLVVGVVVVFTHDAVAASGFGKHLPFDAYVWAALLIVGDLMTLGGMIIRHRAFPIIRLGAFFSFSMWMFGSFALITSGSADLVGILTGPYVLIYAYLYLAASLGVFRRDTAKPQITTHYPHTRP